MKHDILVLALLINAIAILVLAMAVFGVKQGVAPGVTEPDTLTSEALP